jgi:hypothetical protein
LKNFTKITARLLFILALFGAHSAAATPVGTIVNCTGAGCTPIDNGDPLGTVVDPGAEFTTYFFGPLMDVDITPTSIILTMLRDATLTVGGTTLTISNLGWADHPGAVITSFDSFLTNWNVPLLPSAITTADSAVMIAFPDLVPYGGTVGQTLSFDFVTNHPAPVPEPSSTALLVLGLAGIGFMNRRRRGGL